MRSHKSAAHHGGTHTSATHNGATHNGATHNGATHNSGTGFQPVPGWQAAAAAMTATAGRPGVLATSTEGLGFSHGYGIPCTPDTVTPSTPPPVAAPPPVRYT